ncbi:DNA polymerase epsilon catalytic subunit A [Euphorbia peplus]|nr:DNA polymerase epsilon catalytic subunit A [Euphorbia peplus]
MNAGGRRWGGRKDFGRSSKKQKLIRSAEEELDAKFGFDLFSEGDKRLGWLLSLAPSSWEDQETGTSHSCVDLYFVTQDGSAFKSKFKFRPYFYAATKENMEMEVEAYLRRRFESQVADVEIVEKEDLNLKNHLSGLRKRYLKISFSTVQQLMDVKRDLSHVVERNQAKFETAEAYESILTGRREQRPQDFLDCIVDLREYDVPYHVRFAIDNDIRCGQWYDVSVSSSGVMLEKRTDLLQRAEVRICAFDIETTKLPLKFPDAEYDSVMMISYMIDGHGFLIINRECVGEDIEDLEYTPKPEFEGHFKVTNVQNEVELLKKWFSHMQEVKPGIYVTYNGDFFDWPFLETRAAYHGFKMSDELGFSCDKNQGECRAKFACHLDCFAWVKRDSYLPQGSHGLKAVTKAKLGFDPLEVNPEDMVRFAKENPQTMASYSVSDAVSTYYLYMTYVHPFIFSLATIIPMSPDEVLRKGSGTLCEMLLMVEAYKANVICPNKHQSDSEKFYRSHLLESETYIGGHVECLESGVFRSDLPTSFNLNPSAYDQLIDNLDRDLQYAIRVEGKMDLDIVANYDEVKNAILEKLLRLRDEPVREECPLIYHLDVAAMYPNIILTNRLQPPSIVTEEICTACDFNRPDKTCLRKLEWVWRGEIFMAKRSDYYHLKKQIESEFVDGTDGQPSKSFLDLPQLEQQLKLKERLKKYCQKAYKRVLDKPVTEVREAGICMRENPFYVDTVRSFRDRRYEYKGLNKVWKGKLSEAKASGNSIKIQEAQDMVVLYDSLQLAHKCILNSFYGYVMRKGARWYSMEMAGVVTYTGAKIIQNARLLVEKIGKPLELDTDGIWCVLPGSFPENFTFKTKDLKKKLTISYPCVMLNVDVARNNTNEQYQTLVDPVNKTYTSHSECSIEFEVDGPYKAMIIPASKEEGILIKKRYAVFNDDGTLAELKGFEIKRRGELKLIKVFQAELFDKFLHGSTLEECYSAVAAVANRWLDLLDNQGKDIADSELLDFISESSTMSKSLVDYGQQKSCAVTTARRLADFLGDAMVKDKGLRCQYIVASEPRGTPVSERAVPVAIFETDPELKKFYLRKWFKTSTDVAIRSIIDWSYYKQRLSSAIQKIITIPAAMQKVTNPVPRVLHPDWLHKKVREKEDKFRQRKLVDIFKKSSKEDALRNIDANTSNHTLDGENVEDLEDFQNKSSSVYRPRPIVRCYEINNQKHSTKAKSKMDSLQQEIDNGQSLQENISIAENIDKNVDYQGWLEQKKRKWKDALDRRKRQKLGNLRNSSRADGGFEPLGSLINRKKNQHRSGVGSYFTSHEIALTRCHWQIIQLLPSSQVGHFFAWVVVEGIMVKIPVTVPRVFYLNSKAPITEKFPGRRVNKTLPRGRQIYDLVEVSIEEDKFRQESKKLAALLADPEVEGIYETKLPLEFNAILQIGCVCKVDKTSNKRNAQDGWSLNELQMKTTTECSYLGQSIPFFYLYHSFSEGRGIFVSYIPLLGSVCVVVVNPYQNKDLSPSFLERQFREACRALSVEPPPSNNGTVFKVEYVAHVKDAESILQGTISELRDKHHGPTIAVIESPNAQLMKSGIQALDNFPCVNIPSNARDSQYQVLGWQQVAAKIGMQRSAASAQWLNERISLSRYAHVPLGNIELDWLIFTADVFISRALRDQQQLLWVSDDGVPDLGGISEESTCFADEVHQPILIYPGAYRKVTVELKIHHLAVNALLKSNQINEMEGGSLLGFEQDVNSGPNNYDDDATSSAPALRVLKQLIQRCLSDAVTSGNVFADALLQHLYRWLCSPQSKLHDPALHRILHKVMQKVFALLLAEFRKLGSTIVFANFSKVIIDTGKFSLSTAKTYCDSLLKTLQTRELFEWIELEPVQFWHSLLFMDQYNYGGIPARADDRLQNESHEDHSQKQQSQVDIVSSWNIAEYLPKKIQDHFVLIVSEFMFIPWEYAQKHGANGASSQDVTSCTPSITIAAAETYDTHMVKYLQAQIGTYFTDKLLGIVRDTVLHMKGKNKSDTDQQTSSSFSQFGDDIGKRDPALEFIKHVCAVLALDHNVQHEVLVLRKNLLKYVRVREFAPEAEFHDPCPSFVLPNVICSYCNDCKDLDLCRDSALLGQEWRCAVPQCGQPYNQEVMENALLQIVRQRERLYHLQDLVCTRCNQVKALHLADQCACGGSYRCKEDVSEFRSKMQVFLNIAVRQKFQLLQECTSWILEVQVR